MKELLRLEQVHKWVGEEESRTSILNGVSLQLRAGEFVSIMGASGSGKSTLLNLVGLLDVPSAGKVYLDGEDVVALSEDALALRRAQTLGFIFQSFHLLPYFTALENVLMPMQYRPRADARERATALLTQMNLAHRLHAYPATLSGGERQRVAIARSLANDPSIILADEPTGALDSRNGQQILETLTQLHRRGVTLVLVTHDSSIARRAQRVLEMKDGCFI